MICKQRMTLCATHDVLKAAESGLSVYVGTVFATQISSCMAQHAVSVLRCLWSSVMRLVGAA